MGMLDDLVREILAVSTTDAPWSDAFGLAYKLNLETVPSTRLGVGVADNAIEYDQAAHEAARHRLVAYGVAIWGMREWGLRGSYESVRYVAERIVRLPQGADQTDARELLRGLAPA